MKIWILALLCVFHWNSSLAQEMARVPAIFTGNSPAPAYQNYDTYRYLADGRDSRGYAEYYLNLSRVNQLIKNNQIYNVHAHVRNIAKDGLCDSAECFRVFIFVNGDENSGEHVATFVVSPGTGRRTPVVEDQVLRKYDKDVRWLKSYEAPTIFEDWDMYRIYGSKSYPGKVPNMPNAMFFLKAIAFHGSFDIVDGNKRSHGCIRMFPDESYWMHSLVRAGQGNLTVDVLHTR